RCRIIGPDARLRRQVPGAVYKFLIPLDHVVEQVAHRVLALGLGIEIAHLRYARESEQGFD
ncbi:MAG: hypothetical protein KDK89_02850, partial [Alphaproteobacteria bacterium]|nr:hypothetical protein [Alphaproteobacteria bacterium]